MVMIPDAIENYRLAAAQREIALFDVTQIEKLKASFAPPGVETVAVTFEWLKQQPEDRRNAVLQVLSDGYGVNFGLPEGVEWE